MFEVPAERQAHSMILETGNTREIGDDKLLFRSQQGGNPVDSAHHQIGSVYNRALDKGPVSRLGTDGGGKLDVKESRDTDPMKERFAKLLLGEDMSGGGKGVSSALALSNAITNLAAAVFGEQRKLEPMTPDRKARWKKEVEWLLCVTDYIVEFVPSQQIDKDGKTIEIMITQQRRDLLVGIPALRKLDAMLIDCLDHFRDENEFWYVSKDADESEKGVQKEDRWWLPSVKVPSEGLSDASQKNLEIQKECVNQVLKASMAINAQILSEMEVPENYLESLPKNGRASLGDSVYKNVTCEFFDAGKFLKTLDLSSDHKVLDFKNRIEASIVIWRRKMNHKNEKSSWGSGINLERRELYEERAETILLLLKQRFPGIPQSSLDISKIESNRDVGLAILESYSRVLESLANTVMSRIDDVLFADKVTKNPSLLLEKMKSRDCTPSPSAMASGLSSPVDEQERLSSAAGTPNANSKQLIEFMGKGWNSFEQPDSNSNGSLDGISRDDSERPLSNIGILKKISYADKVGLSFQRSPTARH